MGLKHSIAGHWQHIALIAILVFAFHINHHPHANYDYPVHVDEWTILTQAKQVHRYQNYMTPDPYIRGETSTNGLEIGLVTWLVGIRHVTGLDWLFIFKWFPALVAAILAFFTYIFARRWGYGLEAALFVALIPTNVRILGPGFLVAVSLGITFIPLSLFLASRFRGWKLWIPLFIISSFLLTEHPPTALALFIVLLSHGLMSLKKDRQLMTHILYSIVAASLFSVPYFASILLSTPPLAGGGGFLEFGTSIPLSEIPYFFSSVAIAFAALGIYLLSQKGRYGLIIPTGIFLVLIFLFRHLDYTLLIMPTRGYMYVMLLLSIMAGYGLYWFRSVRVSRPLRIPLLMHDRLGGIARKAPKAIYMVFLVAVLAIGLSHFYQWPYYHIITDSNYNDFVFIKENTPGDAIVLMDPWKANAFPSIGERYIYGRIPPGPSSFFGKRNANAGAFFAGKCANTRFLEGNNITVVYSPVKCENEDLDNPRGMIYLYSGSGS
ncbi:MAG: hypothetical protein DRO99_05390 [Candidatus Aenigmatarchaeota archaeon]|nr:MAG: hypothetical protein DRO99_05390 [Candidatus Aenigmarchaeota archaeon]